MRTAKPPLIRLPLIVAALAVAVADPAPGDGGLRRDGGEVPASSRHTAGMRVRGVKRDQLRWPASIPGRGSRGGAGGAGAKTLTVIQTDYSDPTNGNVVLLIWNAAAFDSNKLEIKVDGDLVGEISVPGGPVPTDIIFIDSVPAGHREFRVEEGETKEPAFSEGSLTVLDDQPFRDVSDLECRAVAAHVNSTCVVRLTWSNAEPLPHHYLVLMDGEDVGQTGGSDTELTLLEVGPGSHRFSVTGFLQEKPGDSRSMYRGEFVETSCDVSCERGRLLRRGDCNDDRSIDISDAVRHLGFMFGGQGPPACLEACDVNGDDASDIADPIYLLNYLFDGGPMPADPGADTCGVDPDPAASLGCKSARCP